MDEQNAITPAEVRRALRSLATGDARESANGRIEPARVVDEATDAFADVHDAAAFVADDGLDRVRRAIGAAERTGERKTARAGQRLLATVERYRAAATVGGTASGFDTDGDVSGTSFDADRAESPRGGDYVHSSHGTDYFHSSRGTVLRGDTQDTDE